VPRLVPRDRGQGGEALTGRRGQRPRDIGTAAETAVVRYLRDHGFAQAERRALRGQLDAGDITGTPDTWEIKGGKTAKTASDGQVAQWLEDTERERINGRGRYGILVLQRAGYGPLRCGYWWIVVPLGTFFEAAQVRHHHPGADVGAPIRMHLQDLIPMIA